LYCEDERDDADVPNTSSSVIDAQLFTLLPFTVTLTNLTLSTVGKVYFSELSVVPLLSPLNFWLNEFPSVDVDMVK
jgi:hypothetical protein